MARHGHGHEQRERLEGAQVVRFEMRMHQKRGVASLQQSKRRNRRLSVADEW